MNTSSVSFDVTQSSSFFRSTFYPEGLSDKEAVATALKAHDYTSIALRFWAEPNTSTKLEWFEENHHGFHPLLLGELALVKFLANPTKETVLQESMPLLDLCRCRIESDYRNTEGLPSNMDKKVFHSYRFRLFELIQNKKVDQAIFEQAKIISYRRAADVAEHTLKKVREENPFFQDSTWLDTCVHSCTLTHADPAEHKSSFLEGLQMRVKVYREEAYRLEAVEEEKASKSL